MEPPDCRAHDTEIPHQVDGLAVAYPRERIAHDPADRESFSLPASGRVYLCGQMLFKIHPDFDRLLGDLLERDPDGTVVLFDAPGHLRARRADRKSVG